MTGVPWVLPRSKNKMSCVHRDLKPANLMLGGIPHDSTGAHPLQEIVRSQTRTQTLHQCDPQWLLLCMARECYEVASAASCVRVSGMQPKPGFANVAYLFGVQVPPAPHGLRGVMLDSPANEQEKPCQLRHEAVTPR